MKRKSFTLIEMVVSIGILILLSVAFTPGLTKYQQQSELKAATAQIQNAIYDTRSLAISPNFITPEGHAAQDYILIVNITNSDRTYGDAPVFRSGVYQKCWDNSDPTIPITQTSCPSYTIKGNTYVIFAVEGTSQSIPRYLVRETTYPGHIKLLYDYPCHATSGPGVGSSCTGSNTNDPYFWKPHFRNTDGMIGYNGPYYDTNSAYLGDSTKWGHNPTATASRITVVWKLPDTFDTQNNYGVSPQPYCSATAIESIGTFTYNGNNYPCQILEVNNVTGASIVY